MKKKELFFFHFFLIRFVPIGGFRKIDFGGRIRRTKKNIQISLSGFFLPRKKKLQTPKIFFFKKKKECGKCRLHYWDVE